MGFNIRFIALEDRDLSLGAIEAILKREESPAYAIVRERKGDLEGTLTYEGKDCGTVLLQRPGDEHFESEVDFLKGEAAGGKGRRKKQVIEALDGVKALLIATIPLPDEGDESERWDPLWSWLIDNCEGLVWVDFEGFHDRKGLALKVEWE